MRSKIFFVVYWLLAVMPLLVIMFLWDSLPEQIPMRYNWSGQVSGWGTKSGLFVTPVINLVLAAALYVAVKFAKEQEARKALQWLGMYLLLFIDALSLFFIYLAYTGITDISGNINKTMSLALCLFWILMGYQLPKVKQNKFIGLKNKYTFSDPEIWDEANAYMGKLCCLSGYGAMAVILVLGSDHSMIIICTVMIVTSCLAMRYSKKIYDEKINP